MNVLIAGSKGQAKDLVSGFFWDNHFNQVVFFDDVSEQDAPFFDKYPIYSTLEEAKLHFDSISPNFIVAVASPFKRKIITEKLIEIGGKSIRFLSPKSLIYNTEKISNEGVIIQIDCILSPEVKIDKGVLINAKSIIESHVEIGEYSSLAPRVHIQQGTKIGKNCIISTGVTIHPNIVVGDNVKIWMNKVVSQDIPSNTNLL